MRIDWEGQVGTLYVHAQYALHWDDSGEHRVAYIEAFEAYDEAGTAVETSPEMPDLIAEAIDDERED